MVWYEVVVYILGGVGGISGIITLYNAKVNKEKIKAEVTTVLNEEWRKLFETRNKDSENYRNETKKEIDELKSEVKELCSRDINKSKAISRAYGCEYSSQDKYECPVIKYVERDCELCQK